MLIGAVLALLLALLLVRVDTWSDELRLAGINVKNHPTSSRSNYFYANALLTRYRQSKELGLEQQDSRDALIASRYYLERMYETNPRDVAALVMLHSLDTQFVANAADRRDWLGELEILLESRQLQASDLNALYGLIGCLIEGGCDADRERILRMLASLEARYPSDLTVLGLRYTLPAQDRRQHCRVAGCAGPCPGARPRTTGVSLPPDRVTRQVAERRRMYATVGQWLLQDRRRLRLLGIKGLFTAPADAER